MPIYSTVKTNGEMCHAYILTKESQSPSVNASSYVSAHIIFSTLKKKLNVWLRLESEKESKRVGGEDDE